MTKIIENKLGFDPAITCDGLVSVATQLTTRFCLDGRGFYVLKLQNVVTLNRGKEFLLMVVGGGL